VIVPTVSPANIRTEESGTGNLQIMLGSDAAAVKMFVSAPPKVPLDKEKPTEFKEGSILSACWWVSTSACKQEANMQMEEKVVKGVAVPILKNTSLLEPYTKLIRYVPPPKPKVSCIEPAPKKKQKKQM